MNRKRIGVVAWKLGENSFGVTIPYLNYINLFGDPVILLPTNDKVQELDLLILPGGMDINPTSYGEKPSFYTGHTDVHKQWFYDVMLPKYIESGTPIFGICLGMQQIAAHFGMKLCQNLFFHEYSSKSRDEQVHDVEFSEDAMFLLKNKKQKVNSLHHQALLLGGMPDDNDSIVVLASATCEDDKNDRIIEAIMHRSLPIIGVQWHPEEIYHYDRFSNTAIRYLLDYKKNRVTIPLGRLA